ncbi:MAG: ATP-binding protein [Chloroflexi bacterium]|nr:ATP-binding protein [Chloroflexota bacterium]
MPVAGPGTQALVFTPPELRSIEDTGLGLPFLSDLVLKVVYYAGTVTGGEVARRVGLPFVNVTDKVLDNLKRQILVEVKSGASIMAATYEYTLTNKGYAKAQELIERSAYVGVAPVPLATYQQAVQAQSIRGVVVTREQVADAFAHLVTPARLLSQLGPAINSGRSIFLFGPPGNGKTSLAETAARLLGGAIHIPHAVVYDAQVVKVFDPTYHQVIEQAERRPDATDRRWVLSQRPVVIVGGELILASLDLVYSETSRYYEAPLQLKANGGMLLIDDFGRQLISPRDLLNRWIVPLEKGVDYLNLRTGQEIAIPFDQLVIFSTNMEPRGLVDEAFLRRIRYKIEVPNPSPDEYAQIFARVCEARGIPFDLGAVERVLQYCARQGLEPRSCHPRDLVDQLINIAAYTSVPPTLGADLLDLACESYFVRL